MNLLFENVTPSEAAQPPSRGTPTRLLSPRQLEGFSASELGKTSY